MSSNTTARPRWVSSSGVAALGFRIAPSGQRLPRSTHTPDDGPIGSATVPITYPVQPGDTIVIKERWF